MLKNSKTILLLLLLILSLTGCATKESVKEETVTDPVFSGSPFPSETTFTGSIPCEDCLRVDITLNIRPDTMYQLRKTYLGQGGPTRIDSQVGKWMYLPRDRMLILGKQKGLLKTYVLENNNRLRFVEWQGTDNANQIQYALVKSAGVAPFDDIVKIRGKFSADNGVGSFEECSTGLTFPVAGDRDYPTLLQNYMNVPHTRGDPLLVSVMGRFLNRGTSQEVLLVEKFRKIYSSRTCEGDKNRLSLTGTYWHLLEVDGLQVVAVREEKPPYILLDANKTFETYSGCNKITGSFLVKGDAFLVKRNSDIRMACPGGLTTENKYIQALEGAEFYRINGDVLELYDQDDKVRARFQAGS